MPILHWMLRVLKMGLNLGKPSSNSLGTLSGLAFLIGGVVWLIGTIFEINITDAGGIVAILGLGCLFLILAPYYVWKRDTEALQCKLDKLEPLKSYRDKQRGNEGNYLHLGGEIDLSIGINDSTYTFRPKLYLDSGLIEDVKSIQSSMLVNIYGSSFTVLLLPTLLKAGERTELIDKHITVTDASFQSAIDKAREALSGAAFVTVTITPRDIEGMIEIPQERIPIYFR